MGVGATVASTPLVEFRLLGPLEVTVDGRAVPLGGRKQRSVLAMLVLRCGEVVSVDHFVDRLWGLDPPGDPGNALQVHMSALRRALDSARDQPDGPPLLVNRPPGYVLNHDPECVDAFRFQRLVAAGRSRWAAGDGAAAADLLHGGLGLWRGPALADLADERFAGPEIARLEELRLSALEARIDADLALGRHDGLVPEIEGQIIDTPLRERLRGQLMVALYRTGRQADALRAYQEAREALLEQLGIDPGPELQRLEQAILVQDPALNGPERSLQHRPDARTEPVAHGPAAAAAPAALRRAPVLTVPAPATSFLGRSEELAQVVALVRATSLVTLTGVGGSGKTRLALQAATELAGTFPDGVHLVDLSAASEPADVAAAIGSALGVPEVQASPLEATAARLAGLRVLLVLDTCEQVADGCALAAAALTSRCPDLRILATSRRVLGLVGEHVVPLEGLTIPADGAEPDPQRLMEHDAVRLFVERAVAVAPGFRLAPGNAAGVADVVRHLDGLPLALELAAARIRVLSPAQLAERLDTRLAILTGGDRSGLPRHQTLRATIDWSYALLAPADAAALDTMSVFSGRFDLTALEAVAGDDPTLDVLDILQRLIDHSLVAVDRLGARTHYRLLETIREYAAERLASRGGTAAARARHTAYHVGLVLASDRGRAPWVARVADAHADVLAALDRLLAEGHADLALEVAAGLGTYWLRRGALRDGRRRLERALAGVPPSGGAWAEASVTTAALAFEQGDYEATIQRAGAARTAFEAAGDGRGVAAALCLLGRAARGTGDLAQARALSTDGLERFRELGDAVGVAGATRELGIVARAAGDHALAARLLEQGLEQLEELHQFSSSPAAGSAVFARERSRVLVELGRVAGESGDLDRAARLFNEGLGVSEERQNTLGVAECLHGLGAIALEAGAAERAVLLLCAGEALAGALGALPPPAERVDRDRLLQRAMALLPPARYAALVQRARDVDLESAIALAREP